MSFQRWCAVVVLASLALLLFRGVAQAQAKESYPIFSVERASVAAGVNSQWLQSPSGSSVVGKKQEWNAGVYAAYQVIPHASLVGSVEYGLDSKQIQAKAGVRIRLWRGDK